MIRTAHSLYRIVCSLLPAGTITPPLCWLWDEDEVLRIAKIDPVKREADQGYSARALLAIYDEAYDCIFAPFTLADKPIAKQVLIYLHEIAHANGHESEDAADAEAIRLFRLIARRSVWKQKGITLKVRRKADKSSTVDDLVYSIPARLPPYQPPW